MNSKISLPSPSLFSCMVDRCQKLSGVNRSSPDPSPDPSRLSFSAQHTEMNSTNQANRKVMFVETAKWFLLYMTLLSSLPLKWGFRVKRSVGCDPPIYILFRRSSWTNRTNRLHFSTLFSFDTVYVNIFSIIHCELFSLSQLFFPSFKFQLLRSKSKLSTIHLISWELLVIRTSI